MIQPARSDLVEGGKYTIVIRATDGGKPPLHTDVKVTEGLFIHLVTQLGEGSIGLSGLGCPWCYATVVL